ncbi:hypothetical protein [Paenibacillus sp. 481]|uniref:hypothetical protein n=1 Tax=Paenibacillus sp. 481 TaxID=2835869 RepID=UPI001E2B6DBD|nr:hypothetical protein [Paenibacillus sp. 481]UHA74245.1 hypothetical protein KIK04_03670 [Paenibacillus sp. 481]
MRNLETVLAVYNILLVALVVIGGTSNRPFIKGSVSIALLLTALQMVIEGIRWEMLPTYAAPLLVIGISVKRHYNPRSHRRIHTVSGWKLLMLTLTIVAYILITILLPTFVLV